MSKNNCRERRKCGLHAISPFPTMFSKRLFLGVLLPHDKYVDLSKLKIFADDNLNVVQMMEFIFDGEENIVENGENAGYQHFLFFPQCFQRASCSG